MPAKRNAEITEKRRGGQNIISTLTGSVCNATGASGTPVITPNFRGSRKTSMTIRTPSTPEIVSSALFFPLSGFVFSDISDIRTRT